METPAEAPGWPSLRQARRCDLKQAGGSSCIGGPLSSIRLSGCLSAEQTSRPRKAVNYWRTLILISPETLLCLSVTLMV